MKTSLAVLAAATLALASGSAVAGKVSMPKKGSNEFVFCVVLVARLLEKPDRFHCVRRRAAANTSSAGTRVASPRS